MDPAVATLDLAKAGAIIADMIESYLAGGAPPSNQRETIMMISKIADRHLSRKLASTFVIDDGASPLNQESTERQYNLVSKAEALVGARSGSESSIATRSVRLANDQSRRLQDAVSDVAKGQKYVLLSHKENLTNEGRKSLRLLLTANKRLNTAISFESPSISCGLQIGGLGTSLFDNWKAQLRWQRLKPYESSPK